MECLSAACVPMLVGYTTSESLGAWVATLATGRNTVVHGVQGKNTYQALAHSLNLLTKGIIGICGSGGRELAKESWSMDEVQKMVVDPEEITSLVNEMNLRHQKQDEVDWRGQALIA